MGGSLGSIGNAISSAIKPLAQTILTKVAPAATNLLKNVVGSAFEGIKHVASSVASGFPALGNLASKLMQGAGHLKDMAMGGLEKAVSALVSKVTPRPLENGQTVTPATLPQRGGAAAIALATTAATAAALAATGASASSSTAAAKDPDAAAIRDLAGGKVTPESIAKEMGLDMSKPDEARQAKMEAFKENMQRMNELFQMLTQMMTARHETSKAIISNMRV